jgi:hypothetical protein
MGRTQRKKLVIAGGAANRKPPRVLDDTFVDQVLELDLPFDAPSGDPVAGIRNGVLAGLVFWALLALVHTFA